MTRITEVEMAAEKPRCLVCDSPAYTPTLSTKVHCTQFACVMAKQPIERSMYDLMQALLADRYRAGYQQALCDMTSQLTELENGTHEHRRSNRSDPHAD